jgi:predicted dehydrogenase
VGCGRIAKRHAEHIIHYGKLAAVCDIDETKAACFSETYSVPFYTSIESLLELQKNVDVVVVCTPNGLHAKHSLLALNAGKHVLCEKPMAITVADCRDMIAAAEANNRLLLIVKQNRYNPPVIALKKALDAGKLGKVYSLQLNCFWNRDDSYYQNSWKGTKSLDGGTLFTQFSHFIDLLYWMFGDVETIKAITGNFAHSKSIEFEDTGAVILQFKTGIIGGINFTVNAYKKNMEGSLTVFAEKGTVKIGGQYLNTLEYENVEGNPIGPLPPGNPSNEYGSYQGSMSNHDKVYENLLSIINENQAPGTTVFEALKTVEIITRIYKEANSN